MVWRAGSCFERTGITEGPFIRKCPMFEHVPAGLSNVAGAARPKALYGESFINGVGRSFVLGTTSSEKLVAAIASALF